MSNDRLPAGLEAASIIRRVECSGDFATILKRGDPDRGSILLMVTRRGDYITALERNLSMEGKYCWGRVGPPQSSESPEVASFLEKRARFDPDCWAIELDIANPERFIAETTATG